MLEIEEKDLIEIIKECCAYIMWKREECLIIFDSDDREKFEEIILEKTER